jgi:hypothetical protein
MGYADAMSANRERGSRKTVCFARPGRKVGRPRLWLLSGDGGERQDAGRSRADSAEAPLLNVRSLGAGRHD